jgi:hypothetical protein
MLFALTYQRLRMHGNRWERPQHLPTYNLGRRLGCASVYPYGTIFLGSILTIHSPVIMSFT